MAAVRKAPSARPSNATLLEFFPPIDYTRGMALEDALRGGQLSRIQVAILWFIRSKRGLDHLMPRKEIERLLSTWYEVRSSAIRKALRAMASPRLCFVEIVEDPGSRRKNRSFLLPKANASFERWWQQENTFWPSWYGSFRLYHRFRSRFLESVNRALNRDHPDTAAQTKSKRSVCA